VLGISKLRNEYKPFEAKRQLCQMYDLFLADDRVVPLLPKLLGKKFYETKKKPAKVDLRRKNLVGDLDLTLHQNLA
jgi:ribosome biogenesis protein UTP30